MSVCKFCKTCFKTQGNGRTGNHQKHIARKHIRIVNKAGQILEIDENSFPAVHVFVMFNKDLFENATEQEINQQFIEITFEGFQKVVEYCIQERLKEPNLCYVPDWLLQMELVNWMWQIGILWDLNRWSRSCQLQLSKHCFIWLHMLFAQKEMKLLWRQLFFHWELKTLFQKR